MGNGRSIKRKGLNFERKVKRILENQGYFVVRSAGSKGVADLVALSKTKKLLISCREKGNFTKTEKSLLLRKALEVNGQAVLAYKEKGGVKLQVLTASYINE